MIKDGPSAQSANRHYISLRHPKSYFSSDCLWIWGLGFGIWALGFGILGFE
jgi:hypothetical protein